MGASVALWGIVVLSVVVMLMCLLVQLGNLIKLFLLEGLSLFLKSRIVSALKMLPLSQISTSLASLAYEREMLAK